MINSPKPLERPTKMYESFLEQKKSACCNAPVTYKEIYYNTNKVETLCLCHKCGERCELTLKEENDTR